MTPQPLCSRPPSSVPCAVRRRIRCPISSPAPSLPTLLPSCCPSPTPPTSSSFVPRCRLLSTGSQPLVSHPSSPSHPLTPSCAGASAAICNAQSLPISRPPASRVTAASFWSGSFSPLSSCSPHPPSTWTTAFPP